LLAVRLNSYQEYTKAITGNEGPGRSSKSVGRLQQIQKILASQWHSRLKPISSKSNRWIDLLKIKAF
jgi:hypothetical protein